MDIQYKCDDTLSQIVNDVTQKDRMETKKEFDSKIRYIDTLMSYIDQVLYINTPCVEVDFVDTYEYMQFDFECIHYDRLLRSAIDLYNENRSCEFQLEYQIECQIDDFFGYAISRCEILRSHFMFKFNELTQRRLGLTYVLYIGDGMYMEPIVPLKTMIKYNWSKNTYFFIGHFMLALICVVMVVPMILVLMMWAQYAYFHRMNYKLDMLKDYKEYESC